MLPECVFCIILVTKPPPPKMWKFGIGAKSYLYMYIEYLLKREEYFL